MVVFLAGAATGSVVWPATAADWRVTPSMSVGETFTDNVGLATGRDADRNSDLITSATPAVQVRGVGGRGRLNLNYSATQKLHRQESERDDLSHALLGGGDAELWKRMFFVDGGASISRQRVSTAGPLSTSLAGQDVNTTEVRAINFSPSFRHHFGRWAETESRIRFDSVSTATREVAATRTIAEQLRINSGRRFSVFLWSLSGDSRKTQSGGDVPTRRQKSVDANGTYVLGPKLSLLSGIGHQDIEDQTLNAPPQGMTWNFGFAARPSGRTAVRATYGERDATRSLDLQASHRLSERTNVSVTYGETIRQSSQQQLGQDLSFLGVDPAGNLIDTRTGLPFVPGNNNFGLQNNSFRQDRFQLRIDGSRRRNTFNGGILWEKRHTDATNVTEMVKGADVQLGRTLSSVSSGNLALTYRNRDLGTGRVDNEIGANISVRYQILTDVDATLAYNLTLRKVNNVDESLTENSLAFRLSKRF